MGCCFNRIYRCAECSCFICSIGGIFYHMYDEGNLTCGIVKDVGKVSSEIFVDAIIKNQ